MSSPCHRLSCTGSTFTPTTRKGHCLGQRREQELDGLILFQSFCIGWQLTVKEFENAQAAY